MRSRPTRPMVLALAATAVAVGLEAQQPARPADMAVDATTRGEVIEGVLAGLRESYVFPDKAEAMEQALRERLRRGEYERISSATALADSLTAHLQAVSRDKHLRVRYSQERLPPQGPRREPTPEERERALQSGRRANHGFERVERLAGNVGYLELRGFMNPDGAEETVAAAMSFLANTDALIIDLRRNGGGSPQMVALISSYLFGPEPVHLNSLYWRPENRTDEFWTRREVAGRRYGPDRPVYVLTSDRTFSAAEEFSYNLKNLQRATLVGETTGGGAHPGGTRRVSEHFAVFIPSGRAISPITKTNWEGTGVEPHVAVAAEQALQTAHRAAVERLLTKEEDPRRRRQLEAALRELDGARADAR